MLKKVESYILKHKLLTAGAKVIVGTSGGADSVALLHILKQLGFQCIVAHCNFHLRGEESYRDERFVQELASKLDLDFRKIDFDTTRYAQSNKVSIEMAARNLRYRWFEELRVEMAAEAIAVAHHADDNVETLLMNLTRGTGLAGMTGIPVRNGVIIRPLLCCTREEIINVLKINDLNFVTDSSNAENEYIRNRFRNEIIPIFETINPAFRQTIKDTIARFEEIEDIYKEHIALEISRLSSIEAEKTSIDTTLLKSKKYAKTILYELLSPCGFHNDSISKVLKSVENEPGAIFYSATHQLLIDRDKLVLTKKQELDLQIYTIDNAEIEIFEPIHLKISRQKIDGQINKSANYATFDASKMHFPLVLRRWKQGDSFVPFGMKTNKKVSDFFIDKKINRFEKEKIWLLISQNEIAWIVGHRIDSRFSVDNNTTETIEIQLIN